MIREINFNKYYNINSTLHSLDPRIKIIAWVIFIIMLFTATTIQLIFLFILALFTAKLVKMPIKYLFKELKFVIFVALFFSVFLSLINGFNNFLVIFLTIYLRFFTFLAITMIINWSTKQIELIQGFYQLLTPRFAKSSYRETAANTAFIFMLTIKFIPEVFVEFINIYNLQKTKGYLLQNNLKYQIKLIINTIIPTINSLIYRSENIANNLEMRNLSSKKNKILIIKTKKVNISAILILFFLVILIGVLWI